MLFSFLLDNNLASGVPTLVNNDEVTIKDETGKVLEWKVGDVITRLMSDEGGAYASTRPCYIQCTEDCGPLDHFFPAETWMKVWKVLPKKEAYVVSAIGDDEANMKKLALKYTHFFSSNAFVIY